MVSFYAFPMIFIDTVTFKKGTLIKRACVRTPWTPPGSAPDWFTFVEECRELVELVACATQDSGQFGDVVAR